MDELSPRQREVLDCIAAHIDQVGYPPSMREIGNALGIRSTNGVADHIKALVRKGYLEPTSDGLVRARSLRLTERSGEATREQGTVVVPVLGDVAAGQPIVAQESYEGSVRVDADMLPHGGHVFALHVRGESMIEEGILDGDLVFVRQQPTARNGELVVAMVEGEATVKRFFLDAGGYRLQPANQHMQPIFVRADERLEIIGKVVGLHRRYYG